MASKTLQTWAFFMSYCVESTKDVSVHTLNRRSGNEGAIAGALAVFSLSVRSRAWHTSRSHS